MRNESKDEDDSSASSDSSDSSDCSRNNENNNRERDNYEQDTSNNIDEDDNMVHHCFNYHRRQTDFLQQFGRSYHTDFFQLKGTDVKT